MVIGDGLIASRFKKYIDNEEILIFASGVSNSKHSRYDDFQREKDLLIDTINNNKNKLIVYFSSCSLLNSKLKKDEYHFHKKRMEEIVSSYTTKYLIFRLSNVVGKWNEKTNTIVHYLVKKTLNQEEFTLWKGAIRNIIDIDDVYNIIDYILTNNIYDNKTINIANIQNMYVEEIAVAIKEYFGKSQKITILEKKEVFKIDVSEIIPIINCLNIDFERNYLKKLLDKYYGEGNL